ncbi:MAG: ATP-binding protein [Anaerovoracaceae bacterium]
MYSAILFAFTTITLIISFAYFYMFSRKQEQFMQFWGFSWVAYSLSLLCLIFYLNNEAVIFLEIRKVIDMFNILLLLFGVYAFMHVRIPVYWYRFSLYLVLLAGVSALYQFDLFSLYLPLTIYQFSIALVICYHIVRHWTLPLVERIMATTVFVLWGIGHPLLLIFELYYHQLYNLYIAELVLSNVLNFCILVLYIQNAAREYDLGESLYKKVVENAKDAIIYYRLHPYEAFAYVTPSIEALTGYAPKTFYHNPRQYLNLVAPEYFDEITDVFGGKIDHSGGNIFKIIKKNGEYFWGEVNTTIVYDKQERAIAIECILRDITEMKSAQIEQINAKESRDLLLSYLSHELRTPLTSIAGYLTALNDGIINEPEEVSSAMEIITTKTTVLKSLVDDLDQLSKLETNQFSFNFMTCRVTELCAHLISDHINDIRISGFQPTVVYNGEKLQNQWVVADESRINQVFSNFLSNAMKYTKDSGQIQLCFDIDWEKEDFVVAVRDFGPGIAEKDLAHIFDRFYRVPGSIASGRGLGLTISSEIIEAHKGKIFATSKLGDGATFTFTLPLYPVD